MKKLLAILILLCGVALGFASCSNDAPEDYPFLFKTPVATDVTATTATVSCTASSGAAALPALNVKFAYGPADADVDDYLVTTNVKMEGDAVVAALKGLTPQTAYRVYAFYGSGTNATESPVAEFTTLEGDVQPVVPAFGASSSSNITKNSATISSSYTYSGTGTVEDVYFIYRTTGGADQMVASTVGQGAKSASLTGLTPATAYTFQFCVVVDGVTYKGSSASFTTLNDDAPVVPVFGASSSSSVTQSGATISSSFTYAGSATIEEVYFLYRATGGSDQKVASTTTQGVKSTTLSGLTGSTAHTFNLCVKIGGTVYQSTAATFTTLASSGGSVKYQGWAELPVEKTVSDHYYAYHLCTDVYVPSTTQKRRNYTTCYSNSLKCAIWVAAPMHDCYAVKNSSRTEAYKPDPNIPVSQPGKWAGYTRGHMLGSAERLVSRTTNEQVFYYSNIVPQLQTYFNTGGGAWNTLEDWVDTQWVGKADTTYQVIGSYWANKNKVVDGTTVPTHYYKVLLRTKNHANKWVVNCSRDELQCIVIMVEHKTYAKAEVPKPAQYQSKGMLYTVAQMEAMTGLTFFANVPNAPKDVYNVSDWGL